MLFWVLSMRVMSSSWLRKLIIWLLALCLIDYLLRLRISRIRPWRLRDTPGLSLGSCIDKFKLAKCKNIWRSNPQYPSIMHHNIDDMVFLVVVPDHHSSSIPLRLNYLSAGLLWFSARPDSRYPFRAEQPANSQWDGFLACLTELPLLSSSQCLRPSLASPSWSSSLVLSKSTSFLGLRGQQLDQDGLPLLFGLSACN